MNITFMLVSIAVIVVVGLVILGLWANKTVRDAIEKDKLILKTDTHIVIKREDLNAALGPASMLKFNEILAVYGAYRMSNNKDASPYYMVCNEDEPYAKEVWAIIRDGELEKLKK